MGHVGSWITPMTRSARCLQWSVVTMIATTSVLRISALQSHGIDHSPYVAAEVHPGSGPFLSFVLTLYPLDGHPVTIPLPATLPRAFNVIAFSSDGRAIYVQKGAPLGPLDGILEIRFKPTRLLTVPGSLGLGAVYLTDSLQSAKVFVSGASRAGNHLWHCGAFE